MAQANLTRKWARDPVRQAVAGEPWPPGRDHALRITAAHTDDADELTERRLLAHLWHRHRAEDGARGQIASSWAEG